MILPHKDGVEVTFFTSSIYWIDIIIRMRGEDSGTTPERWQKLMHSLEEVRVNESFLGVEMGIEIASLEKLLVANNLDETTCTL
jgi:hypothetical protein